MKKSNWEILFKDSPEYFIVSGAFMIQEGAFVRFIYPEGNIEDDFYPINNIYRVRRKKE